MSKPVCAEVDRLRQEQQQLQEKVDEKSDESKDGDKKDGKEEGGDKDKKKDKDKDRDEEQKEPAKEKAQHWAKAHPIYVALMVIGVVALLIGGFILWRYLESYESTDDARVDGHTDPISTRINGFVVAAYVENTYRVKKGQVLVDLDPRDYEVALAQARANLSQAQAGVRAQTPNVPITQTTQSTQVATAELSVDSAAANLAAAEQSYRSALADLKQPEANARQRSPRRGTLSPTGRQARGLA